MNVNMNVNKFLKTTKVRLLCQRTQCVVCRCKHLCVPRCKHVDIKYHFIRSALSDGKIIIEYCPTADMVADVLTKPVTKLKIEGLWNIVLECDLLENEKYVKVIYIFGM